VDRRVSHCDCSLSYHRRAREMIGAYEAFMIFLDFNALLFVALMVVFDL
jgi:hypothetical protein